MKLSIVTPTYNHAKYIETTIKSVLANNYNDLEYIVVDGGSKDGTQDVVMRYSEYIAKFISEKDEGQADAINKGFKHATGDIYAYINSDDYYFPDAFEKVMKIFEENPDIDFIYGDCVFVDEEGQFHRYFTEIEPFDRYRLTTCSDYIMQPASFWRKSAFEKVGGFDQTFHFGFDWDAWSKMAKAGCKFYYLKEPLAVNREFENTKTLSGGDKRLAELKKIIDKNKEGFFPHAYYGYAYAEEKMKPEEKQSWLKKTLYKIGAYKSIIYNQLHWDDRNLYGINHHSPILKKEAYITFPWYANANFLLISISTPPQIKKQKCTIEINDTIKIYYEFSQKKHFGLMLVDISELELQKIEILIKFDKAITKAFGLKNKILNRRVECSAFLSSLTIIDDTQSNVHDYNSVMSFSIYSEDGKIKLLKI